MSISTDITGGSSSNQLLDLLTVVANPTVYKAKIDALDAATAENKKYVEAIGPASEIFALREEAKENAAKAKEFLDKANAEALQIKEKASIDSQAIFREAKNKSDALIKAAEETKAQVDVVMAQAQEKLSSAQKVISDAQKAEESAQAKEQELTKALQDANEAKAQAEEARADILAKHQAFVQGL
jgi:cell division septum initiation protein DivIVA